MSCLRRDCHACGSKTWISRLLTPVFQLVTPGRKVWAITALTDTFYVNKPEPKGEKKSLCGWSTFSEFSFFSRKSMFLCVPVFVLDGTLRNIFGLLRNVFGYYRTPRKILKNLEKCHVYKCKKVGRYNLVYICVHLQFKIKEFFLRREMNSSSMENIVQRCQKLKHM